MKSHGKKMIAPIIITIIFVIYYVGFAILILGENDFPLWGELFFGLIPLALAGVMIYVLIQRIKEIRSGEEDDLSKY